MIETILEPKYHNNTDYPLNWRKAQIYKFDDLDSNLKSGDRSYEHITYSAPGVLTNAAYEYIRKMSALNSFWKGAANWDEGLSHDFTQARMWSIFVDPENPCSIVVMTFPGQRVEFDKYDEHGCLDLKS